ncbi:MAG: neutral/alkaline non-lysosomal ceramidase N-terminal domain-containing protein [Pirellulaceae bacterium]|nr:neutral/alkaline non-lysosomal ceramidase N-terminal domain-containing protein [Pirellulaceae bacterium]
MKYSSSPNFASRLVAWLSFSVAVLTATQGRTEAPIPFEAGLAVRDITPDPQLFHVPLGGYGERMNAPAEGIHDSTMAKALMLRQGDKKFALVTLDLLGVPRSLRDEVIARIADTGIDSSNLMLAASHTHASVEMAAMNRANVFGNAAIGIFDERLLVYTADKIAEAIQAADKSYVPVQAGTASIELPGMNRNRRGGKLTDNEMTVLRLDRLDGSPLVVHVNYTAHPTYMTAKVMQLSAGWPGYLQRTMESILPGTTCMYSNGAEGDVAPAGGQGNTPFERAESYGQRLAAHAVDLVKTIQTRPVSRFAFRTLTLTLPERKVPKALMQSAGPEYGLNEENIMQVVNAMAPETSYLGVLQIDDFLAVSIPGEMTSVLGLRIKQSLRQLGAKRPVIVGLGNEWISYMLDSDEYHAGGYEPGVSFYGETLGPEVVRQAIEASQGLMELSER